MTDEKRFKEYDQKYIDELRKGNHELRVALRNVEVYLKPLLTSAHRAFNIANDALDGVKHQIFSPFNVCQICQYHSSAVDEYPCKQCTIVKPSHWEENDE